MPLLFQCLILKLTETVWWSVAEGWNGAESWSDWVVEYVWAVKYWNLKEKFGETWSVIACSKVSLWVIKDFLLQKPSGEWNVSWILEHLQWQLPGNRRSAHETPFKSLFNTLYNTAHATACNVDRHYFSHIPSITPCSCLLHQAYILQSSLITWSNYSIRLCLCHLQPFHRSLLNGHYV